MAANVRLIAAGIGAATAAGAAIFGAVTLIRTDGDVRDDFELCLKSDIPFVEGATKKCYAPGEAQWLSERPVLDDQGSPVTINLTHPTDENRGLEPVSNCAQYRALTKDGWYALSSLEMRREAYFQRACGALDLLERARPADVSYFEGEALSEADARSLAQTARFRIGPVAEQPSAAPAISKAGDSRWMIDSGDQTARVQEIAHADFNTDGRGDMLIFVSLHIKDGAATTSLVGLADKPAASGPVSFVER